MKLTATTYMAEARSKGNFEFTITVGTSSSVCTLPVRLTEMANYGDTTAQDMLREMLLRAFLNVVTEEAEGK